MVLEKRVDYGFNGYQLPPTPRATRSPRRRCSFKKKDGANQMCAFDLLAVVAGNLLLDRENTSSSSNTSADKDECAVSSNVVKEEEKQYEKSLKVEVHDGGSPSEIALISGQLQQIDEPKESLDAQSDLNLGLAPAKTTSGCTERLNAEKAVDGKNEAETETVATKVEACASVHKVYSELKIEEETENTVKEQPEKFAKGLNGMVSKQCGDVVFADGKPSALVSSHCIVEPPSSENLISHSSYPVKQDDVDLVSRDDDENSYGCTYPSASKKSWRPGPRIGDRRIRKILGSKYWKVAPRMKGNGLSNADGNSSASHHDRKNYYKCQRSEWIYPFKKRKHFNYSSPSDCDEGARSEFASNSTLKGSDLEASFPLPKAHGANRAASSAVGQHTSFKHRDSQVKLRIKSFRVPELFIEVPENATVGSLKRSVMEAVTAILGGGLHVGVLLRGKKVRDDSKTLLQTGIANSNQLDGLGFSLEPNHSNKNSPLCPGDSPFLLPYNRPQPLSRFPATPTVINEDAFVATPKHHTLSLGNVMESDHESAPSPTDLSIERNTTDLRTLVSKPAMDVKALAMVPIHRKPKRPEIVQRRIRRPFSVAEVEALVQAVEKLGTGRWRDVKLCAFDNAKHRTYVDLKDKWKTLVHTARISPQQRRGEPVPQELLDRVLTAHAYWSQQQPKQQLKQLQPQPETCLLLCDH